MGGICPPGCWPWGQPPAPPKAAASFGRSGAGGVGGAAAAGAATGVPRLPAAAHDSGSGAAEPAATDDKSAAAAGQEKKKPAASSAAAPAVAPPAAAAAVPAAALAAPPEGPHAAASESAAAAALAVDEVALQITLGPEDSAAGDLLTAALPLHSGWTCEAHNVGRHDVFLSYRVASEGADAGGNGLVAALAAALAAPPAAPPAARFVTPAPPPPLRVFWDRTCLNDGESWEVGLHNGLEGAALILPLVSAKALRGIIAGAHSKRDILLLEWEIALARHTAGQALILPIFITDGADSVSFDDSEQHFPSMPHATSARDVRSTLLELIRLNGIKLTIGCAADIATVVEKARALLASRERRQQRIYSQQAYEAERARAEASWRRVAAIVAAGDVVGRGASSVVYRGKLHPDDPDELEVVIKALDDSSPERAFSSEVAIMKAVQHVNCLRLKDYFFGRGPKRYLVLPYCAGGSLQEQLFGSGKGGGTATAPATAGAAPASAGAHGLRDWRQRLAIAQGVARGMQHLHALRIFHRDIKPDNVLLTAALEPRLADFGVSKAVNLNAAEATSYTTVHNACTPFYDAPELRFARVGPKADVYAFGVTLLQLATGKPAAVAGRRGELVHLRDWLEAEATLANPQPAAPGGALVPTTDEARWAAVADARCDWPPEVAAGLIRLGLRCTENDRNARPAVGEILLQLADLILPRGGPSRFGGRFDLLQSEAPLDCCICEDAPREVCFQPCLHALACAACAKRLLEQGAADGANAGPEKCPLCRTPIEGTELVSGPVLRTFQGEGAPPVPLPSHVLLRGKRVAGDAALAAALAAAEDGAVIILEPGVYAGPLLLTKPVSLYGFGQAEVRAVSAAEPALRVAASAGGRTRLDGLRVVSAAPMPPGGPPKLRDWDGGIGPVPVSRPVPPALELATGEVTVHACDLSSVVGLIALACCDRAVFTDCRLSGGHDGLHVMDGCEAVVADTLVRLPGVGLHCSGCRLQVKNCIINGTRVGVLWEDSARGLVDGTAIAGATEHGIFIRAGADPDITNCRLEGCGAGIGVSFCGRGRFSSNELSGIRGAGVESDGASEPFIGPNNRLTGCGGSGIIITGKGRIESNIIIGCGAGGAAATSSGGRAAPAGPGPGAEPSSGPAPQIFVGAGGMPVCTGNRVEAGRGDGILLAAGAKGRLDGNECLGNARHGIVVRNGRGGARALTVLSGNRSHDNRGCGIRIHRDACVELSQPPLPANALFDNGVCDMLDERKAATAKRPAFRFAPAATCVLTRPDDAPGALPPAPTGDRFGCAVALDEAGLTLIVGASGAYAGAGAAYVYAFRPPEPEAEAAAPASWVCVARLAGEDAPAGEPGGRFGTSAAIELGTAVIGAPGLGTACVYRAIPGGVWGPAAAQTLRPGGEHDGRALAFGCAVAVAGDLIAVGAFERWAHGGYVFLYSCATAAATGDTSAAAAAKVSSDSGWYSLVRDFHHGNHAAALGLSVALATDTATGTQWLHAGSPADNYSYVEKAGTAFPFRHAPGAPPDAWELVGSVGGQWKVSAPGQASWRANFGYAVAASKRAAGDGLLVSAPGMNGMSGVVHRLALTAATLDEHYCEILQPDGLCGGARFGAAIACMASPLDGPARGGSAAATSNAVSGATSEVVAVGAPGQTGPRNAATGAPHDADCGLAGAPASVGGFDAKAGPGAVYIYLRDRDPSDEEDDGDGPHELVAVLAPEGLLGGARFGEAVALAALPVPGQPQASGRPARGAAAPVVAAGAPGPGFLPPVLPLTTPVGAPLAPHPPPTPVAELRPGYVTRGAVYLWVAN